MGNPAQLPRQVSPPEFALSPALPHQIGGAEVWAFPDPQVPSATARFLDGSSATMTVDAQGVHLRRSAPPDGKEIWAQILWPAAPRPPSSVLGMTEVPGADPLTLAPGTWTYSAVRGAVAVHGQPGRLAIDVLGE